MSYLLFTIVSLSAGVLSLMELKMLSIQNTELLNTYVKFYHLPLFLFLASIVWFVFLYFKTANKTLAYLFTGLWILCLVINFTGEGNLTYTEITEITVDQAFNGDSYTVVSGEPNILRLIADAASIVFLIYILTASIKLYRAGNKKRALLVGGSILLFIIISGIVAPLTDVGVLKIPAMVSLPFVFIIIAMSMEITYDVVQSKILSNKLVSERNRWSSLLNEMNLPVVRVDNNGEVTYVNKYLLDLTGYKREEMLTKKWLTNFIPEPDRSGILQNFSMPIKKGFPIHYQNGLVTKSGEIRQLFWSNIGLYNEHNELDGLIAVGNDVTDRYNAYKEILVLKEKLETENLVLKSSFGNKHNQNEIVCFSDAISYAFDKAKQVAEVDSIVLLEGETGVGKGVFANYIHNNSSRCNKPFVVVNCAAIPSDLLESELFGYEKGAFTGAVKQRKGRFELADGGTLFLDEIGELPMELQPKLLRVLQDGCFERLGGEKTLTVNARVIAATNKILIDLVKSNKFREDLYYRINVFPITIPPLRKRREDIPKLIDHFVAHYSSKYNKSISKVSKNTYQSFAQYHWPGNIRELQNLVERAVISAKSDVLKTNGLLPSVKQNTTKNSSVIQRLEDVEKEHILKALKECNWQIHGSSGAAELLGINPSTLRSRMKKLNILKVEEFGV